MMGGPQAHLYIQALSSCSGFPQWWTMSYKKEPNEPFPFLVTFSHCIFRSNGNQTRTLASHYVHIKAFQRNSWKLVWKWAATKGFHYTVMLGKKSCHHCCYTYYGLGFVGIPITAIFLREPRLISIYIFHYSNWDWNLIHSNIFK